MDDVQRAPESGQSTSVKKKFWQRGSSRKELQTKLDDAHTKLDVLIAAHSILLDSHHALIGSHRDLHIAQAIFHHQVRAALWEDEYGEGEPDEDHPTHYNPVTGKPIR